jgi:hypothetical protein
LGQSFLPAFPERRAISANIPQLETAPNQPIVLPFVGFRSAFAKSIRFRYSGGYVFHNKTFVG